MFVISPDVEKSPGVVFVHGTTGYGGGGRRWRLRLGCELAQNGIAFVLFDHRGCGYSDGEFEDTTVTGRIEDLRSVLASLDYLDRERIGLFGYSLGSAVAVLHEASYGSARSALLYTLPCEMATNYPKWFEDRLGGEDAYNRWKESGRGFVEGEYFRTTFLDDLENHDVLNSIQNVNIPLALVQPTHDNEVLREISEKAFARAPNAGNKEELIDGTHSFNDDEPQERMVFRIAIKWFQEHL